MSAMRCDGSLRIVSDRISPSPSLSGVTDRHLLMPPGPSQAKTPAQVDVRTHFTAPALRSVLLVFSASSAEKEEARKKERKQNTQNAAVWSEILIKRNIHIIPHLFDMPCPISSRRTKGKTGTTTCCLYVCVRVCAQVQAPDSANRVETTRGESEGRKNQMENSIFYLLTRCKVFSSSFCNMIHGCLSHIFSVCVSN